MGLDTSHDAWHGGYGSFMVWRQEIAKAAGLPPLELMEGFYNPLSASGLPTRYHGVETRSERYLADLDQRLPIRWSCLKKSPLHKLLYHSDCDGKISARYCGPIANALEALLPKLNGTYGGHLGDIREKTQKFIDGLRRAAAAHEPLEFH